MKFVAPRVDEATAWQTASRVRLAWLRKLASRMWPPADNSPARNLPRMELVWIPHHVFELALTMPGKKGDKPIWISVDSYCGAFALFEMHAWLEEGEPKDHAFPPCMSEAEAERDGRRDLLSLILRQRGSQVRPLPGETRSSFVFHYPFWVYYYLRRPGLVDIVGVDGITGDKAPSRRRMGILRAFEQEASKAERIR